MLIIDKIGSVQLFGEHFLKNALSRIVVYIAVVMIQIIMVPYVIHNVGVEEYGIIGVVNSLLSYAGILTVALSATTGRNLVFYFENKEYEKASIEMSTVLIGVSFVVIACILPSVLLVDYISSLLKVSGSLATGVKVITALSIVCFWINVFGGIINSATFVKNRLDLSGYIELAQKLFLFSSIYFVFYFYGKGLAQYAYALVITNVIVVVIRIWLLKKLLPEIDVRIDLFSKGRLKESFSLNGWIIVNQLGALLFLQTDLIVANQVISTLAAGQLAALLVIPMQIRVLATLTANLFAPTQTKLLASGDVDKFKESLALSIRLTGLFAALLIGVYCGFSKPILTLWLGEEFSNLSVTAVLMTFYLVPVLSIMPCWTALIALGENKVAAIITLVMGGVYVVVCTILASYFGILGIVATGCIFLTVRNLLIMPILLHKKGVVELPRFYKDIGFVMAVFIIIYIVSLLISESLNPTSIIELFFSLFLACVFGISIIFMKVRYAKSL